MLLLRLLNLVSYTCLSICYVLCCEKLIHNPFLHISFSFPFFNFVFLPSSFISSVCSGYCCFFLWLIQFLFGIEIYAWALMHQFICLFHHFSHKFPTIIPSYSENICIHSIYRNSIFLTVWFRSFSKKKPSNKNQRLCLLMKAPSKFIELLQFVHSLC